MDVDQLLPNTVGHNPLLAAGVHKQQVFLPVIEKAKIALRVLRQRLRQHMLRGLVWGGDDSDASNRSRCRKSVVSPIRRPGQSSVEGNQTPWPRAAVIGAHETDVAI